MRGVHCVSQVRNVTMAQYEAFSVTDIHHCLVCVHCTIRHFDKFKSRRYQKEIKVSQKYHDLIN